jgi:HK97 family phage prohead protease
MFDADEGVCWGYGNVQVEPSEVCDSYSPEPAAPEAKSGSEVPMTATAIPVSAPNTLEWRRERARSLSESQRKRTETREVHVPLELREGDEPNKRLLRSYASLFDEPYGVRTAGYRFEEVVRPGAFKRTLGMSPDVVFRTEHGGPPLAATWSNDLRLGEDEKGLWYEVDLDTKDPDVQSLIAKVERGVYRESSFAFRVPRDGDRWNDEHDSREILNCELDRGDVSVVTFGASRATGQHMLLRSEEVLREVGFEAFLAALVEWRNYTLLSREERVGRIISAQSMDVLGQLLSLVANADDAIDEAEAMLADFMGVPNPDEDYSEDEADGPDNDAHSGSVTGSEQLQHLGRGEENEGDELDLYEESDDDERAALTTKARNALPASAFVFPKERRYPIHNISHARNALARSSGKPEEAAVKRAVYKKYPSLRPSSRAELVSNEPDFLVDLRLRRIS